MRILYILIFILSSNIFAYSDEFGDLIPQDDEIFPEEVQILETSQHQSFQESVINLLKDHTNHQDAKFEIRYDSDFRVNYIQNRIKNLTKIEILNLNPKTNNFKLRVHLGGQEKYDLNGRYISFLEVPVARRVIRNGEILKKDDIMKVKTKVTNINHNIVLSEEQLLGMEARNIISNGRYFRVTDIKKRPIILMQDVVTMVYSVNNLTVKTMGIAMEEGAEGDKIKIKNEKTGREIYAKIIDKDHVHVAQ